MGRREFGAVLCAGVGRHEEELTTLDDVLNNLRNAGNFDSCSLGAPLEKNCFVTIAVKSV